MNKPCRICIEQGYDATIEELYAAIMPQFQVLTLELQRFVATLTDAEEQAAVGDLISKTGQLSQTIKRNDVQDFYFYYVTRGLYATFGKGAYMEGYEQLQPLIQGCRNPLLALLGLTCPPLTMNETMAELSLLRHADNVFSSVTTPGSPFPFWSEGDGTGVMFGGNQPVGGSGIDMSADLRSLAAYMNITLYGQPGWSPLYEGGAAGFVDPLTPSAGWVALVEKNPIYAWFMAGLTEADHGKSVERR
jgi:hypothetical protein